LLKPYDQKSPQLGRGVFVAPNATLIGEVSIGDFSSVWFNAVVRADVNHVRIGRYSNIQDSCVLHVTTGEFPLVIGDKVTVGHGCILHGCRIGDMCLIGMGAVILDGAEIGESCVVASGSVVLQGTRVPPRTLVAGIPAAKKKEVDDKTLEEIERSAIEYAKLASDYLNEFS
jgi:carbonic anhydrase/acetyltransferase-like protein (isoleucine patch superfamily)